MFKMIHTKKRYLVITCLLAVLITVALLAVSCGGDKGMSTGETDTGDVSEGKDGAIDGYIQELDGDMNSVDPNDFIDSELDDSKLGL